MPPLQPFAATDFGSIAEAHASETLAGKSGVVRRIANIAEKRISKRFGNVDHKHCSDRWTSQALDAGTHAVYQLSSRAHQPSVGMNDFRHPHVRQVMIGRTPADGESDAVDEQFGLAGYRWRNPEVR